MLTGKEWMKLSISVWDDTHKYRDDKIIKHPAIFTLDVARRLISIFTQDIDEVVLDPFAGSFTSIVAARQLGRKGIGIELYEEFAEKARIRFNTDDIFTELGDYEIICDSNLNALNYIDKDSVDFVITSPPYWNILTEKRTFDPRDIGPYGLDDSDIGNISDYKEFLNSLGSVFRLVHLMLKANRHCCIVVMDLRKKDKFYPFHMDVSNMMTDIGFSLEDIIIWNRKNDYNNLLPSGYPSTFRVNKVHEYILIFKK